MTEGLKSFSGKKKYMADIFVWGKIEETTLMTL